MSFITSAIGGISDEHIAEFAFAKPKKIYMGVLMKITAAAACAAVIVTGVPWVGRMISSLSAFSLPSNIITDCWADPDNENNARVVFNGITYLFDNDDLSRTPNQLNEYYEHVGDVLTVDPESSGTDGYSLGCRVGDPIYMDLDFPGEIYVFTNYVTGDGKYIRFTEYGTHEDYEELMLFISRIDGSITFDNRLYFNLYDEWFDVLPDGYKSIKTIDPNKWADFEDDIYQDPDRPGEIIKYSLITDYSSSEKKYSYGRFLDFEVYRQESFIQHNKKSWFKSVTDNWAYVIFNGEKYTLEGYNSLLPDGCEPVGKILNNDHANIGKEGYSDCCRVGDIIYRNSNIDNYIYVYTNLNPNAEPTLYMRFAVCTSGNQSSEVQIKQ